MDDNQEDQDQYGDPFSLPFEPWPDVHRRMWLATDATLTALNRAIWGAVFMPQESDTPAEEQPE